MTTLTYTRQLHERRLATAHDYDPRGTPELREAFMRMQLGWLHSIPGYRDRIRARISEVVRIRTDKPDGYCRYCLVELPWDAHPKRKFCSDRCKADFWYRYSRPLDVNNLPPDIEGCG